MTCFLLVFATLLSGCTYSVSSEAEERYDSKKSTDHDTSQSQGTQYSTIQDVLKQESIEEAMMAVEEILKIREHNYRWRIMDHYYDSVSGQSYPVLWLYAVNDLGEWLDVLIGEQSVEVMEQWFAGTNAFSTRFPFWHKNEMVSYLNKLEFPRGFQGGECDIYTSGNEKFRVMVSGQSFAMHDLIGGVKESNFYWDGHLKMTSSRPAPTKEPAQREEKEGYRTYKAASSMEMELEAMKERLRQTDRGYDIEIRNSIEIEGKEYPVLWMYALDREGEWVDVVFSDDPEFAYYLYEHRDFFRDLRQDVIRTWDEKHPGRGKVEGNTNNWVVQDMFYYGYSYYMDGNGFAMMDCGSVARMLEWNDELKGFSFYYSRNLVWGLNVFDEE